MEYIYHTDSSPLEKPPNALRQGQIKYRSLLSNKKMKVFSFPVFLISKSLTHPGKHRHALNLSNCRKQKKRNHWIIDLLLAARKIMSSHQVAGVEKERNGREGKEQGLIRLWSVTDLLLIWIGCCCHGDGSLSQTPLRWVVQVWSEPTKARAWLVKQ